MKHKTQRCAKLKTRNIYGGGANTNKHGLFFEQKMALSTAIENAGFTIENKEVIVDGEPIGMVLRQSEIYKKFLVPNGVNWREVISGELRPDNAFINYKNKTAYIIEVKYQERAGSVDEKLQTCYFKKRQYTKLFSKVGYTVEYIYVCNEWYKKHKYEDVHEYIKDCGCQLFINEIPLSVLHINS